MSDRSAARALLRFTIRLPAIIVPLLLAGCTGGDEVAETYTVTYDGNGADVGSVPVDENLYEEGDIVHVLGHGDLRRADSRFLSWNRAADGSGESHGESDTFPMPREDVTLHAAWEAVLFKVTYDGNGSTGGSVPFDSTAYHTNGIATVLDNAGGLTREGYTFDGWSTTADGSGTVYGAGDTLVVLYEDVTLFARWIVFVADTTAPTLTRFSINEDAAVTYVTAVTLELEAQDAGSGIKDVRFSQDGGAEWSEWQAYVTTLEAALYAGTGTRTVMVQVRDNSLNVAGGEDSIEIDTRGPLDPWVEIDDGAYTTTSPVVVLTAGASTPVIDVCFANDTDAWGEWIPYSSPFALTWTLEDEDGLRKVKVMARDANGNTSTASTGIRLDRVAPIVDAFAIDGGAPVAGYRDVVLENDVSGGVLEMSFANENDAWGPWMDFQWTYAFWPLADQDGTRTVRARYRDAAGNVSETVSDTIELDRRLPVVTSFTINGGAATTTSTSVTLEMSVTGAVGMMFMEEGGASSGWVDYSPTYPWVLSAVEGQRTVRAYFRTSTWLITEYVLDTIGLVLGSVVVNTFSIDGGASHTSSTSVTLNSDVSGATEMRFSSDGGTFSAWMPYAATHAWTLVATDGCHSVRAEYRDGMGHSDWAWANIWLDRSGPVVNTFAIESGAASTSSADVRIEISVSGVYDMSFSNDGSIWSDWEAYRFSKTWLLAGGGESAADDGTKTVYARFRDQAGNTTSASDSIVLDAWKTVRVTYGSLQAVLTGDWNWLTGLPEPGEWYWDFYGSSSAQPSWYAISSRAKASPWSCGVLEEIQLQKSRDFVVRNLPGAYVAVKGNIDETDGVLGTQAVGDFDATLYHPTFGARSYELQLDATPLGPVGKLTLEVSVLN